MTCSAPSVLTTGIVWQRFPVAASCVIFLGLISYLKNFLYPMFAVLVVLACLEKLAATANTIAVERDWVGLAMHLSQKRPLVPDV